MKVAIIVPYFGTLPNYFQLFLDTCAYNPEFDWLIISNDTTDYTYPANVHLVEMPFADCQALVQSKFDFPITLHTPQKLCDYKCAYGYIFDEFLIGFDWWGHCDLDQIFGRLSAFITEEMLQAYDRIGSIGHLTLYRNTEDNNRVFSRTDRYKEVFTTEKGCGFDEWLPDNINEIYLNSGRKIELRNLGADINSYCTTLQTVEYDVEQRCYVKSPVTNSVFRWEKGILTQLHAGGEREYPYVHLQKRPMKDMRTGKTPDRFFVIPNRFVDGDAEPEKMLKDAALRGVLNTQFFRVKWKSLRYRLKSGDWKFSNVFRK